MSHVQIHGFIEAARWPVHYAVITAASGGNRDPDNYVPTNTPNIITWTWSADQKWNKHTQYHTILVICDQEWNKHTHYHTILVICDQKWNKHTQYHTILVVRFQLATGRICIIRCSSYSAKHLLILFVFFRCSSYSAKHLLILFVFFLFFFSFFVR